jgi:hypothetical protein
MAPGSTWHINVSGIVPGGPIKTPTLTKSVAQCVLQVPEQQAAAAAAADNNNKELVLCAAPHLLVHIAWDARAQQGTFIALSLTFSFLALPSMRDVFRMIRFLESGEKSHDAAGALKRKRDEVKEDITRLENELVDAKRRRDDLAASYERTMKDVHTDLDHLVAIMQGSASDAEATDALLQLTASGDT